MKKPIVDVRKIMNKSIEEIRDGLKTNLIVRFDDNVERELSSREVILNRYVWDVTLLFKNIPILNTFDITQYYEEGYYVSGTFNRAYEAIVKYIILNVLLKTGNRQPMAAIWEHIQITFNRIYNEVIYSHLEYVSSLDIEDFLHIQMEPELIEVMRRVDSFDSEDKMGVSRVIDECYTILDKILRSSKYHGNKVAQGYVSKTVKKGQVQQVLGCKGVITNLNNEMYKKAIGSTYTTGLTSIADMAIEQQTGAKSIMVSKTAVSQSEYLARKIQLVSDRLEHVLDGDCGSTEYLEWYVKPSVNTIDGKSLPHFPTLIGKWYLNEETGKEEIITKDDRSKIEGKTIKLRSPLKCKCLEHGCVCSKCLGILAYNIPEHGHIGHISTVSFTEKLTQFMLSLKHNIASASSLPITINNEARRDFYTKDDDNLFVYLKSKVFEHDNDKGKLLYNNNSDYDLYLKVAGRSARGLADITPTTEVRKFSPFAVTALYDMWLIKINRETGVVNEIRVDITKDRKRGSFTIDFLEHIQALGEKLQMDTDGNYIIPVRTKDVLWRLNDPIIQVPDIEFSYSNYAKAIGNIFGASGDITTGKKSTLDDNEEDAKSINTQEGFLYRLFTEINEEDKSKMNINIGLLEVVTVEFSVNDYEKNDFRLPRYQSKTVSTRNIKNILANGSLGGAYAYQQHTDTMLSPGAFDMSHPVNHIMDVYLCPEEAIADFKK